MRSHHKTNRFHFERLEHRRLLSFSVAGDYAVGGGPDDVVIADFNGDGRADLATINSGNVSVLLGNGAGGFAAAQHFPTSVSGSTIDLECGDLNGDGKADLAAATGPRLLLLFGNGNGSFGAAQVVSTPPGPPESYGTTVSDVEVADVNADGKSDLVYGFYYTFANEEFNYFASYVGVSLGNGNGAFAAPTASYWVGTARGNGLAVADLNGDAKLDVAASTWQETPGQDNVAVLIGLGNGAFSEGQSILLGYGARYGVPSNGLAAGDFDADGNADLAKTDEHYGIFVLMGNGDGTFDETVANYWAGQIPQSVDTADFNLDGKLDLLTGNYYHTVSLLAGNGDGTFAAPIDYAAAPGTPAYVNFGAAAGDLNNDGRPDVAAVSQPYFGEPNPPRPGNVRVLLNQWSFPGKTWIGPTSGGNWSTAANWSPSGVPTAGDAVLISGKSVNLAGSATVAGLTLTGGASLTVAANGNRVLRTSALSIATGSKLDLKDNDLIVDYTGASPAAAIEARVRSGYNVTGDWQGNGITSSTAAADGNFTLAVADNALLPAPFGSAQGGPLFSGINVDFTTVLVKFTHRADINLDGRVTPDDSAIFGGNYDENQFARWSTGDLNYDGLFTPDDSAIFGGSYDESLPLV